MKPSVGPISVGRRGLKGGEESFGLGRVGRGFTLDKGDIAERTDGDQVELALAPTGSGHVTTELFAKQVSVSPLEADTFLIVRIWH